jgi:hypothetical protein
MLTNQEPDWNIDDLTETEIYAAIRYLEADPRTGNKHDANDQDKDNGVVICVCLYILMLGCFASCGSTGVDARFQLGLKMRFIRK